jgi:hypothetical protein
MFNPLVSRPSSRVQPCCLLPVTCSFLLVTCSLLPVTYSLAVSPADLASPDPAARDAARQELLVSASAADVPALAQLLLKPDTFDNACFLLEALRLPEADAALRDALTRTSGREQAGLLQALSRRADPAAEQQAAALLAAPEPVRSAALAYLGFIATPGAVATLTGLPPDPAVADAVLAAAGTLAARRQPKQAAALYTRLLDAAALPDHLRLAALSGLFHTDADLAAARFPAALADPSPVWRGTAARLSALLPDKALKRFLSRSAKPLAPEARAALLHALAATGNRAGAPFARECLEDPATAVAAADALGVIGDAGDARVLLGLLGHPDPALGETARTSLIRLADPKTDRAVLAAFKARRLPLDPAALLSVAAARKIKDAAPLIAPYLKNESPAVRAAAFNALAAIGDAAQAPAVASAALAATDPAEIRAAEKTLAALARAYPAAATEAVAAACKTVPPAPPAVFFQPLALASQQAGLGMLAVAAEENDEALRTLANIWKTPDAIPVLLEYAEKHAKPSLRIVALRGAIRLFPAIPDPTVYDKCLAKATALAARPEEKDLLAALPPRAPNAWPSAVRFVPRRIGTFRSEACCVADFNGDGKPDIAAGEYLYLAPAFAPLKIRSIDTSKVRVTEDGKGYCDNFCDLALDVNGDGRPDIVSGCWFSQTSTWYENTLGKDGLWPAHEIDKTGNHETGSLHDITGNGRADDFLPHTHGTYWFERDGKNTGFTKHTVSDKRNELGAGVADINGDGRPDILRPDVWFEAPKDIRKDAWTAHPAAFGARDGKAEHTPGFIAFDVNKDGLTDIMTSSAHKYGIFWYEQVRDASSSSPVGGVHAAISWRQHLIDDTWTQAHSLALADLDGDGHPEYITGKRFMAHNGSDPDEFGILGVYYYSFTPGPDPVFRKHVISYNDGIGAGLNIVPVDIDGDGDIDLVTTGKWGGPVLFENLGPGPALPESERLAHWKPLPPFDAETLSRRPPPGAENLARAQGASVSADSELNPDNPPAKLTDGKTGGDFNRERWHSALTPMPHWAEIKLAKPAKVCRVIAHFADPAGYATAYEIQAKQGDAYKTVSAKDDSRESKTLNVTFSPVETDAIRFVIKKNANSAYPNAAQLSELEVYAQ